MCGILGIVAQTAASNLLYEGLQVLQHRGQDAAGIATSDNSRFYMYKGPGLVRDVFNARSMAYLKGTWGAGHCRYPTAGSAFSPAEAQPFYVNSPFGLTLVHNGNLTNGDQLKREMFRQDRRQINTNSDSEILLNVFAHELQAAVQGGQLNDLAIYQAVAGVHRRCRGAYAVIMMIAGYGLLAFRDPFGIRPLILGRNKYEGKNEYLIASESVAMDCLNFEVMRDVAPGEAILISPEGEMRKQNCAGPTRRYPCLFEYVYLARPDSLIDGISVYDSRLRMGRLLAEKIKHQLTDVAIDAIIPIPDSSRPAAMEVARMLQTPYREGFVKNRYVGRTFIMPGGQSVRKQSVRRKLNAIHQEFNNKNVLLVDDSIVRGTTSQEIVQMARDSGARHVYFASAAPPVRFPNVYGIDMPKQKELIAANKNTDEVCLEIGADRLIYQDLMELTTSLKLVNPSLEGFETSCFDGNYITDDITPEYLRELEDTSSIRESVEMENSQIQLFGNL